MALDDFSTDDTNTNGTSQTSTDAEIEFDREEIEFPKSNYEHPSGRKDFRAEYDEEYLKECWRCGSKSVRLSFLSTLHDVWFCSNPDCRNSIKYKCEVSARTYDLAQRINVHKAHWLLKQDNINPDNMGLDDFTEDDDSSSDTSSSSSSTTTTSTDHESTDEPMEDTEMSFYGNGEHSTEPDYLEREGPVVPSNRPEIFKTTEDVIVEERDEVKFHAPIFPLVCHDREYEGGKRYALRYEGDLNSTTWDGRVVTCFGGYNTQLGKMTKEQAMFETGTNDRDEVMSRFRERFGEDVDASTEVTVYFFGDTLHLRDLAQANEVYREGERINRDKLVSRVLHPNLLTVSLDKRAGEE